MLAYLTLYEFLVALAMALGGLCVFVWAAAAGLMQDVEAAKHRVLAAEDEGEGPRG